MMMSAETRFTVTLIAIGAGTIAAKGFGAKGPFSKRVERGEQL
jgi:hypothetical protein